MKTGLQLIPRLVPLEFTLQNAGNCTCLVRALKHRLHQCDSFSQNSSTVKVRAAGLGRREKRLGGGENFRQAAGQAPKGHPLPSGEADPVE